MTHRDPLLDQMATSRHTRWTIGVLVAALIFLGCFLSWHAGTVHATDTRGRPTT